MLCLYYIYSIDTLIVAVFSFFVKVKTSFEKQRDFV